MDRRILTGHARVGGAILVSSCLTAFLCVQPAFAQIAGKTPAPAALETANDKRAKQAIDDAIVALGGNKFLSIEDRVETGRAYSFYNERLSGLSIAKIYTRYLTVTEGKTGEELGVRERQAFGKDQDYATVFREDGGATVTWRGGKVLPKDQFDRYTDSTLRSVFYIFRQRLHEPGLIFEWRGMDVADHQPVNIVDITDSQNRVVTVYFHQTTKLPVKQAFRWRDPKTRELNEEVTYYARYRETDGIQWPQEITRERNGERIYQIFADSVAFNQDLTDDLFSTTSLGKKK